MLSKFSRSILKTLKRAEEPLTPTEIANRLSTDGETYVGSHVEVYLQHALQDRVHQVDFGRWTCDEKVGEESSESSAHRKEKSSQGEESGGFQGDIEGLSQLIVEVLKAADASLKAKEIANIVTSRYSSSASQTEVNQRLYGDLRRYVEQDSQYRWSLKERAESGGLQRDSDKTSEESKSSSSVKSKREDSEVSHQDLADAVRDLMRGPTFPISGADIAEYCEDQGYEINEKQLREILYNDLSNEVYYVVGSGWTLRRNVLFPCSQQPQVASDSDAERAQDEKASDEGSSRPEAAPKDGEKDLATAQDQDENSKQTSLEKLSPSGRAAQLTSRLEMAKQIVLFLDLSPHPLSPSRLTKLLQEFGHSVTEKKVRGYLDSFLSKFVRKAEGGYQLREEEQEAEGEPTTEVSLDGKTGGPTRDSEPVDSVTRASIAGPRYNYIFEEGEHDDASMFASQIRGGTVKIEINSSHSAFTYLQELLRDGASVGRKREQRLGDLVKLLIIAWTNLEGDLTGQRKDFAEEMRNEWGRAFRLLLRERESE